MIETTVDTAFFHSWFRNYVKGFYSEDPKIQENVRLKEEHTLRVCKEILGDNVVTSRQPEMISSIVK